ncbi:MAG: hypothetical protein C5B45_06490 [Chlamydiae bacterium]|nr:MAG: hypothetical protein C5B45_06490 [Chlamydiota bacterium]
MEALCQIFAHICELFFFSIPKNCLALLCVKFWFDFNSIYFNMPYQKNTNAGDYKNGDFLSIQKSIK